MTDFEVRLSRGLRAYADRAALDLPASRVVADVVGRPVSPLRYVRRLAPAALVGALVLLVGALAIIGPRLFELGQGSRPATATVNGVEYAFGVARGLVIDQADLIAAGEISAAAYPQFVGKTAFRLPGVDPAEALVVPSEGLWAPEPIEWAILFGERQGAGRPSDAYCSYLRFEARSDDGCPADVGIVQLYPAEPLPRPYDWWGIRQALAGRGFGLESPTAGELARLDLDAQKVVADFAARGAVDPDQPRLVSVHLAAVTFAMERLQFARTRELMYVAERTGHLTGNCFELVPVMPSEVPIIGACFFSNRADPAGATTAPPSPTPSPSPATFEFEGRLAAPIDSGCVRVAGYGQQVALVRLPAGFSFGSADEGPFVTGPLGIVARAGDWVGLRGRFVPESTVCPALRAFAATELEVVEVPAPADGGPAATLSLTAREYRLGERGVTVVRELVPGLGWPAFGFAQLAGAHTIALTHRDPDTGQGSLWLADLVQGHLRRVPGLPVREVVAARDGRLLVGRDSSLQLLHSSGVALATLEAENPGGAFLADGSIAVWSGGRIGVWDPADVSASWSPLPGAIGRYRVTAAGNNVVVIADPGGGMLLDPRTGQELGPRWSAGETWQAAASSDGTRFVVAVASDPCCGPHGALELRDSTTGEVLAVNPGVELSHVTELAWPTGNLIVIMRAPTGTGAVAQPELLSVDAFEALPLPIDAFTSNQFGLSPAGNPLIAVDEYGDLVLVRILEE